MPKHRLKPGELTGLSPSPSKERGTTGVRLIKNPFPLVRGRGAQAPPFVREGEGDKGDRVT